MKDKRDKKKGDARSVVQYSVKAGMSLKQGHKWRKTFHPPHFFPFCVVFDMMLYLHQVNKQELMFTTVNVLHMSRCTEKQQKMHPASCKICMRCIFLASCKSRTLHDEAMHDRTFCPVYFPHFVAVTCISAKTRHNGHSKRVHRPLIIVT